MTRLVRLVVLTTALPLLGAAQPAPPRALAGVQPGLWALSRSATGHDPRRVCVAQMVDLVGMARPLRGCRRTIVHDRPGQLVAELHCEKTDLARSEMTVITPRSIKVATHGIYGGLPFEAELYARRLGACPGRR